MNFANLYHFFPSEVVRSSWLICIPPSLLSICYVVQIALPPSFVLYDLTCMLLMFGHQNCRSGGPYRIRLFYDTATMRLPIVTRYNASKLRQLCGLASLYALQQAIDKIR